MAFRRLLLFVCVFIIPLVAIAYQQEMIETPRPPVPPLVDPGVDAALLQIHVMESGSQEKTSATVCVNNGAQEPDADPYKYFSLRSNANRQKGPIRFRPMDHYFYTDGYCEVRVPAGSNHIRVMKGYEYRPVDLDIAAAARDTVAVTITLNKAVDMDALGWYAGDTHIHMDRTGANDDTLLTITSAKNIRYAYLLSMNTRGYDRGRQYESWLQAKGLGDRSAANRGRYFISSGQEYRPATLGHVTIIMPDAYVPGSGNTENVNEQPSLSVIADQAHALNGFIGLAHGGYNYQEADRLLMDDKMDFVELLQFGGYRSLGLDGWYDFLNIGYQLPIVGACDFPYTRELGSEITYAWSNELPTPRSFARALADGKSFATSGPLLFLTVAGKKPGEAIHLAKGTPASMDVEIQVESPIYPVQYLDLIVNGQVKEQQFAQTPRHTWRYQTTLKISASTWIAARTYADAGTDAHTNPVYVHAGDSKPFNRDSARNIIARLEGSIEAIPNKTIVVRLMDLKKQLEMKLAGR